MEIEYLQKYSNNVLEIEKVEGTAIRPCSIEEIVTLEKSLNNGKPFPKVLREFLYIGGNYSGLPFDMGYSWMKKGTKACLQGLENRGLGLDRSIVVFDQLDSEQYSFIYLDEGDNPQPWNCFAVEDEETIWKSPFATFKDEVETAVDLALEGRGF